MGAMTVMDCFQHLSAALPQAHTAEQGTAWCSGMVLLGAAGCECQEAPEASERREFLWRAEQNSGDMLGLVLV